MWGKDWYKNIKCLMFMFICIYIVYVFVIFFVFMCIGVVKVML